MLQDLSLPRQGFSFCLLDCCESTALSSSLPWPGGIGETGQQVREIGCDIVLRAAGMGSEALHAARWQQQLLLLGLSLVL